LTAINGIYLDLDQDDSSGATNNDYLTVFKEGKTGAPIADSDSFITEVDDSPIFGATIKLTNPLDNDMEYLTLTSAGRSFVDAFGLAIVGLNSYEIRINGAAPRDLYEQLLHEIIYENVAKIITSGERKITVVVNNRIVNSNIALSIVTIIKRERLVISFNGFGTWMLHLDQGKPVWTKISPMTASYMQLIDGDNDGKKELVLASQGNGTWIYDEDETAVERKWVKIHALPATMIKPVDVKQQRKIALAIKGQGLFIYHGENNYEKISAKELLPGVQTSADIDGDSYLELVVCFYDGVYSYDGDAPKWSSVVQASSSVIQSGNFDADVGDELALSFPYGGTWIYDANGGTKWRKIHELPAQFIKPADIDGNGLHKLAVDFGVYGLYLYDPLKAQYIFVHGADPSNIESADLDGDGRQELFISFSSAGTWIFDPKDSPTWQFLHGLPMTFVELWR
jgi:hypothetical protein